MELNAKQLLEVMEYCLNPDADCSICTTTLTMKSKHRCIDELLKNALSVVKELLQENEQLKKAKYVFSTVDYCSDDLAKALEENADLKEKVEDLETMIFAFVWNRGVAPVGKHLGKSEEEIADKVLETIREGEKMICYPVMRKRMQEAKARLEAKEGEGDGEE